MMLAVLLQLQMKQVSNTNPTNDGAGTIVIKALASSHTANGSNQITIANGTLNNSTVTLN